MSTYSKRPLLLITDWDGSLSTTSTLPFIASIATSPGIHPKLEPLSAAYSDDIKRHDNAYAPRRQDRATVQRELAYLSDLNAVERASIERIEASGIFQKVRPADVEVAASKAFAAGDITIRRG